MVTAIYFMKRLLPYLLAMLALLTFAQVSAQASRTSWEVGQKLTWDDFSRIRDNRSGYSASVYWELSFDMEWVINQPVFEVHVFAIKTKSWRDWLSLIKIQFVWEMFEQGESPTEVVYKMIEEMEEASKFMEVDAIWSKDSLATKGNLQDLRVQVHQFRSQGKNIIDNTIDGVFPRKIKRK